MKKVNLELMIDDLYTLRKSLTLLNKELLKNRAPFNFSDYTNQMNDCDRLVGQINNLINDNPQIKNKL